MFNYTIQGGSENGMSDVTITKTFASIKNATEFVSRCNEVEYEMPQPEVRVETVEVEGEDRAPFKHSNHIFKTYEEERDEARMRIAVMAIYDTSSEDKGGKIAAIQFYQKITGCRLLDARNKVEAWALADI